MTLGPLPFALFDVPFTVFDVFGLFAVATMLFMLLARAAGNLRTLGKLEPPGVRKD